MIEHGHGCVNHYQIEPFHTQTLGTGLASFPQRFPLLAVEGLEGI